MDANSLYGAALETVKRFWQMNEARHAACRAYQFDGSDESKQTMIENKPAANPCGFNRAARRVFMAVGFSQVCNV